MNNICNYFRVVTPSQPDAHLGALSYMDSQSTSMSWPRTTLICCRSVTIYTAASLNMDRGYEFLGEA